MKDVAEAAGVAQSTVSRILNAPLSIRVSEETRQRVQAIATELGYHAHPFATTLRGAPSMLLGAVVRDITDPFFASAIEILSIKARAQGYSVVLGHEAVALTALVEARQCDAIVLLGDLHNAPRLEEDLRKSHVHVVVLWHGAKQRGHGFPTVSVDNRAGIRAALRHLNSLGHRRIAFAGGDWNEDVRERRAVYVEYLQDAGIAIPDGYVRTLPTAMASGELALEALEALLALPQRPTAILAATDTVAMGLIHSAHKLGVAIPEKLSIVGFDDIPIASVAVPGLTTVRMPLDKIMSAGVELAIGDGAWADAAVWNPPRLVFKPKLIVRQSTAAASDDS
ncbi:MAG TPA: LacI family DNA-binding transcriptional regulator [Solirubrobacteraceae bacterium]|nr:LacI family DNA-binding transcriptional regulator [Solirubrobacteraceae bacterium]